MFQVRISFELDPKFCRKKGRDCEFILSVADPDDGEPMFMCGLFCQRLKEEGSYCLRDRRCLKAEDKIEDGKVTHLPPL